ncbi:putative TLC domain-containing protein [Seiridium unicorne]|uniref:TLC domain-containing protein n=1 Tax=Seiridium unicorne TaxID=138068 RepID=A0ABR2ULE3_9PEZI
MSRDRDWNDALTSSILTLLFALIAYCHYGSIIHRSTWDRQNLWLPIVYTFFPQITLCHILMNTVLCVQRHKCMRTLYRGRRQIYNPNDGVFFYICAVLGMHTRSRNWHHPAVALASGETEKATGMLRINTVEVHRLKRTVKFSDDADQDRITWVARLGLMLFLLYQITLASMAYYKRLFVLENSALQIDYIGSLYAFSGLLIIISSLIIHIQPYEWDDPNDTGAATLDDVGSDIRGAMPDIDTSNGWVYEGFSALTIQLLVWVGWRLWTFLRFLKGSDGSWRITHKTWLHLLTASMTPGGIALTFVLVLGGPLMIPTLRDVFTPYRSNRGMTWLNRKFGLEYYRGGRIIRFVFAMLSLAVTGVTWWQVAQELKMVQNGSTELWNVNWTLPNPPTNAVVDTVCFLYC